MHLDIHQDPQLPSTHLFFFHLLFPGTLLHHSRLFLTNELNLLLSLGIFSSVEAADDDDELDRELDGDARGIVSFVVSFARMSSSETWRWGCVYSGAAEGSRISVNLEGMVD